MFSKSYANKLIGYVFDSIDRLYNVRSKALI